MTARTQAEILTRYQGIDDSTDWMGFRREALASLMDSRTLQATGDYRALEPGEDPIEASDPAEALIDYFTFACEKASGHRGISASRSIEKLTEFAWAAGFDDAVAAMETARYANYGAPKLYALAEAVDALTWPVDDDVLHRMSLSQPCTPDCMEGCDA